MISKRSLFHKQGDVGIFPLWNKRWLSNILRRNKRQLFEPHPLQNYNSITHTWRRGIGPECGLRCVLWGSPGWVWSPQHLPKEQKQLNICTTCKDTENVLACFHTRGVHINTRTATYVSNDIKIKCWCVLTHDNRMCSAIFLCPTCNTIFIHGWSLVWKCWILNTRACTWKWNGN